MTYSNLVDDWAKFSDLEASDWPTFITGRVIPFQMTCKPWDWTAIFGVNFKISKVPTTYGTRNFSKYFVFFMQFEIMIHGFIL